MASRKVASAISVLTSEDFGLTSSDSPDNENLQALVLEYFTGNDEITDCESSDNEDGTKNVKMFSFCNLVHRLVGEASPVATCTPLLEEDYYSEGNFFIQY